MSTEKRKHTSGASALFGRDLCFWGSSSAKGVAIAVLGAAAMLVINGLGKTGDLESLTLIFPYHLFAAGWFAVFMMTLSYFQVYFPLLISMNATRRSIVRGILLSNAGIILATTLLGGLIWKLAPGDAPQNMAALLLLVGGAQFAIASFEVVLGTVINRWGKIGTFITVIISIGIGMAAGITVGMTDGGKVFKEFWESLTRLELSTAWTVAAVGVGAYVLAGIFAAVMTRKTEARV